jgi:hypothetical protein
VYILIGFSVIFIYMQVACTDQIQPLLSTPTSQKVRHDRSSVKLVLTTKPKQNKVRNERGKTNIGGDR